MRGPVHGFARPDYIYRPSCADPKLRDVGSVRSPGAGCRVPGVWCGCMVLGAGCLVLAQTRPGQLPTLPLTQLDERSLAADLDNRTFTLTFAQAVPIKDLLLLLVRGTSL